VYVFWEKIQCKVTQGSGLCSLFKGQEICGEMTGQKKEVLDFQREGKYMGIY
jgi:hypothetical protein